MKRIAAILLSLALLSGCAARTPPAPESPIYDPIPEPELAEETTTVRYELNYVSMSLELPEGWDYAYVGAGVSNGEFHVSPDERVGIRFWPEAFGGEEPPALELVCYRHTLYGVCGTGLVTEDVTFDSGLTGTVGTYDGGPLWSYILLKDTPGSYVIENKGAEQWWEDYGAQAMGILNSIRVGEGLITQSEAEEIAKEVCTVKYDTIRPQFDPDTGGWKLCFYQSAAIGGDQTIWIDLSGEVIDMEYGE